MDSEIKQLTKKINNLILANQGLTAEYQYVIQKRDEKYQKLEDENNKNNEIMEKLEEEKEFYKKEYENTTMELEKCKAEIESIKNSRWWKLREKIKRC